MVLMALAKHRAGEHRRRRRPAAERGAALAAGHAEQRRRLGGVRPRHQPRSADAGPVRRPQRHARPELSRHHRPRAGSARPLRLSPSTIRRCERAIAFIREDAGRARLLDRPLGRQLPLRHLAGAAWAAQHRLRHAGSDGAPRGRLAASRCSKPCGGWGETCRSYDDPSLAGQGTPTASQTAWALLACSPPAKQTADAVRAGIDYLLAHAGRGRQLAARSRSPAPASPRFSI